MREPIAYGQGHLFHTTLLDGAGSPPGLVFETGASIVAGDFKRVTDLVALGNLTAEFVAFTSGSERPAVGAAIDGATSTETAVVIGTWLTSGTWAGGDAAGYLFVEQVSGVFSAENINLTGGTANVLTISADFTDLIGAVMTGTTALFAITSTEAACKQGNVQWQDQGATVFASDALAFGTYGHADALWPSEDVATALVSYGGAAGASLTALASQASVNTVDTVVDAIKAITDLLTAAQVEPSAPPASNASPLAKLNWICMRLLNTVTNDGAVEVVMADDGTTPVAESAVSNVAGTITKGGFAAP